MTQEHRLGTTWAGMLGRILLGLVAGYLGTTTIAWLVLAAMHLSSPSGPASALSWLTPAKLNLDLMSIIVLNEPFIGCCLALLFTLLIIRDVRKGRVTTFLLVLSAGAFVLANLGYCLLFGVRALPLFLATGFGLLMLSFGYVVQKLVWNYFNHTKATSQT